MSLKNLIEEMPKAELHLHIEGSLEPEMMMMLANRNDVVLPYASVDEIRTAYNFSNLQDFLDLYYAGMSVLIERQDFFDLAWAYLEKVHSQNVTHVEIFFDPQGHTERGIKFDTVLSALTDALDKAEREFGITSKLIMCFLRHLSEEEAFDTLNEAIKAKDHIFGVGLDSSELGHPPSKFERVYREARKQGFYSVAHCGEEGPAENVIDSLDLLKIDRIDHGNRALDDPELVARIARENIALTVCPLSNLRLQVVTDMKDHPLRKMLQAGLRATVNSDDPAYFGGYMTENFLAVHDALDLNRDEIIQLGRNAYLGSFMTDADKQKALEAFDNTAAKF
jgi:adenosine deaminase